MAHIGILLGYDTVFAYRLTRARAEFLKSAPIAQLDLEDWLKALTGKGVRATIVTDFLDEAYARSPLPPVWSPVARRELIERRLGQQYRGALYKAAIVPPGKGLKPPALASLFSLGQAELVATWVNAIENQGAHLDGIWTFASLAAQAYKSFTHKPSKKGASEKIEDSTPTVLHVIETPSGLRQVLLIDGAPVFSRLALRQGEVIYDLQSACAEAQRTAQYLSSQEWLALKGQALATYVWLAKPDEQTSIPHLTGALNVVSLLAQPDAYSAVLAQWAKLPAALQLLPAEKRLLWRAKTLGREAILASAALLFGASVWLGATAIETRGIQQLAADQLVEAVAKEKKARLDLLRASGDARKAALAEASVAVWKKSIAEQPDQIETLDLLARALTQVPELKIDQIRWRSSDAWAAVPAEQPNAPAPTDLRCAQPSGSSQEPAAAAANPNQDPSTGVPPRVLATLQFTGDVNASLSAKEAAQVQEKFSQVMAGERRRLVVSQPAFETDPNKPYVGILGETGTRRIEQCLEVLDK